MPSPKELFCEKAAKSVIAAFERRRFTAEYCATAEEAKAAVLAQIPADATVGWGGTMTMQQLGVFDALHQRGQKCLDRAAEPGNADEIMHQCLNADVFLMSSNAFTRDGCLVNMDGASNRVAALVYGPKKVVIAVSMNKLCADVDAAIDRIHTFAAPMNAQRFDGVSPCRVTGLCAECLSEDCICCNLVITRFSRKPGRIHIVLCGEELGL